MSHTRGPWRVRSTPLGGVEVIAGSEREDTVFPVCRLSGSSGNHSTQADARLIAAAPELLEALEWLLASFTTYQDNPERTDWPEAQEQAEYAIMKARGAS